MNIGTMVSRCRSAATRSPRATSLTSRSSKPWPYALTSGRRRKLPDMPVQLPVRHGPSVWLLTYARCVVHDYAEVLALVGARYTAMAWTEQPRRCNHPMRRTTPSSCRSCARGTTAPAPIRTSRHRRAPSSSSAAPTAAVRLQPLSRLWPLQRESCSITGRPPRLGYGAAWDIICGIVPYRIVPCGIPCRQGYAYSCSV